MFLWFFIKQRTTRIHMKVNDARLLFFTYSLRKDDMYQLLNGSKACNVSNTLLHVQFMDLEMMYTCIDLGKPTKQQSYEICNYSDYIARLFGYMQARNSQ